MIDRDIFCSRLSKLIGEAGISKVALANSLDVTKQSLNSWLTKKALPTADKLVALARYFDVSLDYLVGRTDDSSL